MVPGKRRGGIGVLALSLFLAATGSAIEVTQAGSFLDSWPALQGSQAPGIQASKSPTASAGSPRSPSQSYDPTSEDGASGSGGAGTKDESNALGMLANLEVKGRAPKTGYDRSEFGQTWADVDRNGCDTRNDILKRDLTQVIFTNSVPCKVQSGTLSDPYTASTIQFVRGSDTSAAVQIDHVVALSDAWQKGAQQLTLDQRTAFANDPRNLQATDGPTNQKKSDGDAATWLPPNKGYRCEYIARQVIVKVAYRLWVTQAEHDAMERILRDCPPVTAPTG